MIRNLLDAVAEAAAKLGRNDVTLGHKVDEAKGDGSSVLEIGNNQEALEALQSGEIKVLGGTAWLWSRPEFAKSVDVLFVDEAGQMSLANVLAVTQAAYNIVLLGDPQQLEQPKKGPHPEEVGLSALQHMLGSHVTIPTGRGIFLPTAHNAPPVKGLPTSCCRCGYFRQSRRTVVEPAQATLLFELLVSATRSAGSPRTHPGSTYRERGENSSHALPNSDFWEDWHLDNSN